MRRLLCLVLVAALLPAPAWMVACADNASDALATATHEHGAGHRHGGAAGHDHRHDDGEDSAGSSVPVPAHAGECAAAARCHWLALPAIPVVQPVARDDGSAPRDAIVQQPATATGLPATPPPRVVS